MGDMADEMIDLIIAGALSDVEYDDPFHKTCKYCGCKHLAWGETDFGWRLYNEQGEIHSCKEYQTKNPEEHEPSTWQKNQIAYERDAVDWDDYDEILGNFGDWGDQ